MSRAVLCLLLSLGLLASSAPAALGQQILLEPVRAGELVLFRSLSNERDYYYVSDKPRLALQADGQPYFSFLRWVQNVRTAAADAERREGDGGGLVHALVTLSVSREQIQAAQVELQRLRPGGKVVGPVMWESGQIALVSAIKAPGGGMVTHVDGISAAPILDGQMSAFSILLTKLGSQVLWDTFQTPTPAIAFAYEMKLRGFRPPTRAILEADFDQIYNHKAFNLGVTHKYFAIDVEAAFDDLRRQGAIKLTEIGTDADLHSLIQTAYTKISDIMFQNANEILKPAPLPTAGADPLGKLATRLASHVTKVTDAAKADAAAQNAKKDVERFETELKPLQEALAQAKAKQAALEASATADVAGARKGIARLEGELKPLQEAVTQAKANLVPLDNDAKAAKAEADKLKAAADKGDAQGKEGLVAAQEKATSTAAKHEAGRKVLQEKEAAVNAKQKELDAAKAKAGPATPGQESATRAVAEAQAAVNAKQKELDTARQKALSSQETAAGRPPALGILASFQMKKLRQRGKFRVDLNKYTESTITMPFAGNIGDVRRFKDAFRRVNLDDPLYQQREIVVSLAGINAEDFGPYLNSVTVRVHKRHAKGAETHDEVLIDRQTFNREGNRFKMLYGWKDDDDRRRWMDYEYKTVWNFAGGQSVETPLQKTSEQAIPASSPYERRAVELQADAESLSQAQVRSLTVKLFYDLAGSPQVKQVTLDAAKLQSARIEYFCLPETVDYEYEVAWRLRGNRSVSSGRQKGSGAILYVDEVPQG